MKVIATILLSLVVCGVVSAAPIDSFVDDNSALVAEILDGGETATHNQGNGRDTIVNPGGGGGGGDSAIPEPATLALLGVGLGLAALRRKVS